MTKVSLFNFLEDILFNLISSNVSRLVNFKDFFLSVLSSDKENCALGTILLFSSQRQTLVQELLLGLFNIFFVRLVVYSCFHDFKV